MDFDSELLPKIAIPQGMMNGSLELLIADEAAWTRAMARRQLLRLCAAEVSGGHAVNVRSGAWRYRSCAINKQRYTDKQGIIAEPTDFEDPGSDRLRKLRKGTLQL